MTSITEKISVSNKNIIKPNRLLVSLASSGIFRYIELQHYPEWAWWVAVEHERHSYLYGIIPKVLPTRIVRDHNNIPLFNAKHKYFWNSFFPSTAIEWNKLDNDIRNSESDSAFKKQILKSIRPSPNNTFNMHNPHGIKLLIRLRAVLIRFGERKCRLNFQYSLDPFCNYSRHIEKSIHFFLHSSNYSNQRKTLFEKIGNIKRS